MRASFFLTVVFGALLAVGDVRADTAAERDARTLFAQGNQHAQDGDYAGALTRFQAAYAKYPNVKILLNIGTMMQQLGRNAEAVNAYDAYQRDPSADPGRRREVEKLLASLDTQVAKLNVVVDDPEATVLVDGNAVAMQDGKVVMRIMPGSHTITAKRRDGKPTVTDIVAVAGKETNVSMHVARPDRPVDPAPTVVDAAESAPNGRRTAGFVSGGIGLAGLAAGGITGIVSLLDHGAVRSACPSRRGCSQDIVDQAARGESLSMVSTVAFAVGVVGAGAGIYLVLSSKAAETAPRVGFVVAPGGGGIGLRGSF